MSHVDEEAMRNTVRFGFDEKQLRAALRARAQTKATVTYFLLLDNQTQGDKKNYLQMELSETSAARLQYPSGMMSSGRDGRGKAPVQTQRLVAERHWRLGVKLSSTNPRNIVQELQVALNAESVLWKRIGPFNYKCKAVMTPPLTRPRLATHVRPPRSPPVLPACPLRDSCALLVVRTSVLPAPVRPALTAATHLGKQRVVTW